MWLDKEVKTYCIFLLASKLARRLEINTEVREVSFVVLRRIFYSVNVKWCSETVNGQQDRLCLTIYVYLCAKIKLSPFHILLCGRTFILSASFGNAASPL
jgi:hypothetical protein